MLSREKAFNIANKYTSTVAIESAARHENANDVISMMVFMDDWTAKKYVEEETVLYNNQPMTCIKAHDARERIWLTPDVNPDLWRPWHATDPELALYWLNPVISKYNYYKGEFVIYEVEEIIDVIVSYPTIDEISGLVIGKHDEKEKDLVLVTHVFKCLGNDVTQSPSEDPENWEVYISTLKTEEITPEEPIDEVESYQEWKQWDGFISSLYQMGDIVYYNDKLWESFIPDNHWEPGVYGWNEI